MKKLFLAFLAFGLLSAGCATDGSNSELTSIAASTVGGVASSSEKVNLLIGQLNSDNALVRLAAIKGISQLGGAGVQAVPSLIPFLSSSDPNVRSNAAFALGQIGPKASAATPELVRLISDSDEKVQRTAVEAIAKIGGAEVPDLLVPLLISANPTVQSSAMELLGNYGSAASAAIPSLVSLAKGNKTLRQQALDTLVKIGPEAKTPLSALLTVTGDADLLTKVTSALSLIK